jgi:hypothetical protein
MRRQNHERRGIHGNQPLRSHRSGNNSLCGLCVLCGRRMRCPIHASAGQGIRVRSRITDLAGAGSEPSHQDGWAAVRGDSRRGKRASRCSEEACDNNRPGRRSVESNTDSTSAGVPRRKGNSLRRVLRARGTGPGNTGEDPQIIGCRPRLRRGAARWPKDVSWNLLSDCGFIS